MSPEELAARFDGMMRELHPVLDGMVKAGWLTEHGHTSAGPHFTWTSTGHARMSDLVVMLDELCPPGSEDISKDELGRIWQIVTLYKNRCG